MATSIVENADCMLKMKEFPDKFFDLELDKDYFEAQEKRFAQHISQLTLQL